MLHCHKYFEVSAEFKTITFCTQVAWGINSPNILLALFKIQNEKHIYDCQKLMDTPVVVFLSVHHNLTAIFPLAL